MMHCVEFQRICNDPAREPLLEGKERVAFEAHRVQCRPCDAVHARMLIDKYASPASSVMEQAADAARTCKVFRERVRARIRSETAYRAAIVARDRSAGGWEWQKHIAHCPDCVAWFADEAFTCATEYTTYRVSRAHALTIGLGVIMPILIAIGLVVGIAVL